MKVKIEKKPQKLNEHNYVDVCNEIENEENKSKYTEIDICFTGKIHETLEETILKRFTEAMKKK